MVKNKFLLNERLSNGEMAEVHQKMLSRHGRHVDEFLPNNTTVQTFTECGSKIGIAVSLIEGMIATSRILWMMDLSPMEIQEALKDLSGTYELRMLMTFAADSPQGRIHAA